MPKLDPYDTLGVTREAPDFVIQAAYRACIKRYHPDHYKGDDARERTEAILEAYRLIGDDGARASYDRANPPRSEKAVGHRASAPPPAPPTPPHAEEPWRGPPAPVVVGVGSKHSSLVMAAIAIAIILAAAIGFGQRANSDNPPSGNGLNDVVMPAAVAEAARATTPAVDLLEAERPALDQVIRFKDASHCEMTRATDKLFTSLIKINPKTYVGSKGDPIFVPGFAAQLVPSYKRSVDKGDGYDVRDNEARLELPGLWHGLKVSAIRYRFMEESSFWEMQVRFLEPPSHVREVLNNLGFAVPAIGEFKEISRAVFDRYESVADSQWA